ncbi:MAG: ABC transporter permease [Bacteroidota bacterium]
MSAPVPQPPRWADRLLRMFCKPELLEGIQGDLMESFETHLETQRPAQARRTYAWEVLLLFRPGIIRSPAFSHHSPISPTMLKNYFRVAFRQLRSHRLFSTLNILGLASSLSVCLLIIMMLVDQYSYDTFHTHKDELFRVVSKKYSGEAGDAMPNATAPMPLAEELRNNYPWIDATVRIGSPSEQDIKVGEQIKPFTVMFTEQSFLEVFSFGWLEGQESTALTDPQSVVLTQEAADFFFPEGNALNQLVTVGGLGEYLVKGIMPSPPRRSHMDFALLVSLPSLVQLEKQEMVPKRLENWENIYQSYVYALPKATVSASRIQQALTEIATTANALDPFLTYEFEAQDFNDISPNTRLMGNTLGNEIPQAILLVLSGLAILIMLSACFNYTNLSIARSLKRAREIGIRKVGGARRVDIMVQFLVESVFLALLSLGLAMLFLEILVPAFYQLDPFVAQLFYLEKSPRLYFIFFGFTFLIGLLAGLFPALHLSRFQPIVVLKNLSQLKWFSGQGLRKVLIVVQFSLSLIFIIGTFMLMRQQQHLMNTELGFQTEQIINVELQGVDYEKFKQKAARIPSIQQVGGSGYLPATGITFGTTLRRTDQDVILSVDNNYATPSFLEMLELPFLAGTNFPEDASKEQEQYIILNETAVQKMGYASPAEAIGNRLYYDMSEHDTAAFDPQKVVTIIGVIEDFHYRGTWNPDTEIRGFAFRYKPNFFWYASVSISGQDIPGTLEALESTWLELDQVHESKIQFFDEHIARMYLTFASAAKILGLLGTLAIIIACLGLLGMVTFAVEGRVKEVGIRKVLGATEGQLIWKLSKSFVWLLLIATVIAGPLCLMVGQSLLATFVSQINPILDVLMGIGLLSLLSLLTVVSQTYFAARANPADSLRTE